MERTVARLLNKIDKLPLSQAVANGLRLADAAGDTHFTKWCRLELAGYWGSNPVMTDETVVPEYRSVAGQHADVYGRLLVLEADLSFVGETRVRNGIEELEALARTRETVVIHDPTMCKLIKDHLDVDVYSFRFSTIHLTGIFSAIREELRRRLVELQRSKGAGVDINVSDTNKEIFLLKPNLWGIGVDLRALWTKWKETSDREVLMAGRLYDIGEKPGKGTYRCVNCKKWTVTLDDDDDQLPPCGTCGSGQHVKYEKIG